MRIVFLCLLFVSIDAYACHPPAKPPTGYSTSSAQAHSSSEAISVSQAEGGSANASSGGNSLSNSSRYNAAASTPATVVGNTTAACRAFIGITGMGRDGGGGIGWPMVDGDCKYMTLASGAFAQGNPDLGWALYCRAPTIKKQIGYEQCMASVPAIEEPAPVAVVTPAPVDNQCDEKIARCEAEVYK